MGPTVDHDAVIMIFMEGLRMNTNLMSIFKTERTAPVQPQAVATAWMCRSRADMIRWLDTLSVLQIGDTAKKLFAVLQDIAELQGDEQARLELIETVLPTLKQTLNSLAKHYSSQGLLLEPRAQRILELSQQLRIRAIMIYQQIAFNTLQDSSANPLKAWTRKSMVQGVAGLALNRAMTSMAHLFVETWSLYLPIPAGWWLRLHQLYVHAWQNGVEYDLFPDAGAAQPRSCHQVYLKTLLLSGCRLNGLRPAEMLRLSTLADGWSHLLQLSVRPGTSTWIKVDPALDMAPVESATVTPAIDLMFYLDITALRAQMNVWSNDEDTQDGAVGISVSLKSHLNKVFVPSLSRDSERYPGQGEVGVALGIIGSHFQMSGQRAFNEVIQAEQLGSAMPGYGLSTTSHYAYDDRASVNQAVSSDQEALQKHTLTYRCELVDVSENGYGLYWSGAVPNVLRCGELITIFDSSRNAWRVGVIRWANQKAGQGVAFGVEILQSTGMACGVRNLHLHEFAGHYMRGLVMAAADEQGRNQLVVPATVLRAGNKVVLRHENDDVTVQLSRLVQSTPSFSVFEYDICVQPTASTSAFQRYLMQDQIPELDMLVDSADAVASHESKDSEWDDVWSLI